MKLSPSDVRRLYGDRLFQLSPSNPAEEVISSSPTESEPSPAENTTDEVEPSVPEATSAPDPVAATPEPPPPIEAPTPSPQALLPEEKPSLETRPEPDRADPRSPRFTEGDAIDWKMKPGSRVALVMRASEFGNVMLTGGLKQCVLQSGLPVGAVGFGIMSDDSTHWDFSDMPVESAVVFVEAEGAPDLELPGGKNLVLAGSLPALVTDPRRQKALIRRLQAV